MPLLQEFIYEEDIGSWINRTPEEISKSVLFMLHDVRCSIGKLDQFSLNISLTRVLEVVESGKYEIDGNILTRIDLSSAKRVIDSYRKYSEGGCQSCVSVGRATQDARSGFYCQVSDPDYNPKMIERPHVRYVGNSPKVRDYYNTPCDDWKPRLSPKLEELISN